MQHPSTNFPKILRPRASLRWANRAISYLLVRFRKMAVGNKRQRLAKKAYLDKNEHLPKPAASEGEGLPSSSNALRKESRTDSSTSRNKNKFGETRKPPTHPLRVPGMRPGEACFLCKGTGHIAKNCPQKEGSDRKKVI